MQNTEEEEMQDRGDRMQNTEKVRMRNRDGLSFKTQRRSGCKRKMGQETLKKKKKKKNRGCKSER